MSFQTPITIAEAVKNIHEKKYLLPAIQREFVWSEEQICRLFDSLMRDYPIGSFLFWYLDNQRLKDYQFYEFIRKYHERDRCHNLKAIVQSGDNITAILDGQQRLTALYIALMGSYAAKIAWKRKNNDRAFPERKFYLNLLAEPQDTGFKYDFQFLTDEQAQKRNERSFWFPVSEILNIPKEGEINRYLRRNGLLKEEFDSDFANDALFALHAVIHKKQIINYYLEKGEDLDKVLNMFIRVNSGGTFLSYSDLLLSIATAQWETRDAREEITEFVEELNKIGDGFDFEKDFILKACLVLSGIKDIAFKVQNFNKANMLDIESKWPQIKDAIRLSVQLIDSFGYTRDTLVSANSLIPIAYYLYKKGVPHNFVESSESREDRRRIQKWLIASLLKRAFSGVPDNVIRPIRGILDESHQLFPLEEIVEKFRGHSKSIIFTEDDFEAILHYRYGQPYTFSCLASLYPWIDFRNKFHQDHIFPRAQFDKERLAGLGLSGEDLDFFLEHFNTLANLQLLPGVINQEKQDADFKEWVNKNYPDVESRSAYLRKHYLPEGVDLDLKNFKAFIEGRQRLIKDQLKQILFYSERKEDGAGNASEEGGLDSSYDLPLSENASPMAAKAKPHPSSHALSLRPREAGDDNHNSRSQIVGMAGEFKKALLERAGEVENRSTAPKRNLIVLRNRFSCTVCYRTSNLDEGFWGVQRHLVPRFKEKKYPYAFVFLLRYDYGYLLRDAATDEFFAKCSQGKMDYKVHQAELDGDPNVWKFCTIDELIGRLSSYKNKTTPA